MSDQRSDTELTGTSAWVAAAAEIVWWWGVSTGVWLLTLSTITNAELAIAASCGLCCAVAARVGRRAVGGRWRFSLTWMWWVAPLVVSVLADSARLLVTAFRFAGRDAAPGQLVEVSLPASERASASYGREALGTLAICATPGTFVADVDPEEHTMVLHSLVSGWPQMQEVVRR